MRVEAGQLAGLQRVERMTSAAGIDVAIVVAADDVATLQAVHRDVGYGPTEIVYADDGYDAWRDGRLEQADLSAEVAADILIREYCEMKARIVARRWSTQGHDGHGHPIQPHEALALARINVRAAHLARPVQGDWQ